MTCPSDLPLTCQLLVFVLAARSKSSCSTLIRKSRNCGQEQPPYVDHLLWKLQFVKIFLLSRAATIRGGYRLTKLIGAHRVPQNILVGPIWRCFGQKFTPVGRFLVPFRQYQKFDFPIIGPKIKVVVDPSSDLSKQARERH